MAGAMFGHSVEELKLLVQNSPLPEQRLCASCMATDCRRIVNTEAPNTAHSYAAALTCGHENCRTKVKANMKEMAGLVQWASAGDDNDEGNDDDSDDEDDQEAAAAGLDQDAIQAAAAAVGCYHRGRASASSTADMPGLENVDDAEFSLGDRWRRAKETVLNRQYWSEKVTKHKARIGESVGQIMAKLPNRPHLSQMLEMAKKNIGLRNLLDKNTIMTRASVFLPSKATMQRIVANNGGKLDDDLSERILTTVTAATPSGIPLSSLRADRPAATVQDTNRDTQTGISIRVGANGGLLVRNPAMAKLAGRPEDSWFKVTETTDASNGRIFELEPLDETTEAAK